MRLLPLTIVGIAVSLCGHVASAQSIVIDGNIPDWQGISPLLTDPRGDGPFDRSGRYFPGEDFVSISTASDSRNLYLLLEFAANHTGGIALFLDTDVNQNTGCDGAEYLVFVTDSEPGGHLALADYRRCNFRNDFPRAITSLPPHNVGRFLEAAIPIATLKTLTPNMTALRISGIAVSPPPSGVNDTIGPPTLYTLRTSGPSCPGENVSVDSSNSNGVIRVQSSGTACDRTITISNLTNYWVNFKISPVGPIDLEPVGGNANLYAISHLLPPAGLIINSPFPVAYVVRARGSSAITVLSDPTVESGFWGPAMNVLQIILGFVPGGSAVLWSVENFQTIQTAFEAMPHLQAFTREMFVINPNYTQGTIELIEFVLSPREWGVFFRLIKDLGVSIADQLIQEILDELLRGITTIVETFVNVIKGFEAGSVLLRFN